MTTKCLPKVEKETTKYFYRCIEFSNKDIKCDCQAIIELDPFNKSALLIYNTVKHNH